MIVTGIGEEVNVRLAALLKEHSIKDLAEELCWEVNGEGDEGSWKKNKC